MATFVPVTILPVGSTPPGFLPPPGYVLDISRAVALWKFSNTEYEVVLNANDLHAVEKSYFSGSFAVKSIKVKAKDINLAVL